MNIVIEDLKYLEYYVRVADGIPIFYTKIHCISNYRGHQSFIHKFYFQLIITNAVDKVEKCWPVLIGVLALMNQMYYLIFH